jgi:hypothetical protein
MKERDKSETLISGAISSGGGGGGGGGGANSTWRTFALNNKYRRKARRERKTPLIESGRAVSDWAASFVPTT